MKIFAVFFLFPFCFLTTADGQGQDTSAPETSILESQVLVRQGEGQKARAVLEDGLRLFPGEPRLYLHLGDVYQTLDQPRDALEAYRAAVNLHPGYIRAYEQMAAVSRNLREWDEAINAYEKIAAIDPSSAAPWFEMAMIYRAQGFVDKERKVLSAAWRLNPDYVIKSSRLRNFEIDALSLQAQAKDDGHRTDVAHDEKENAAEDWAATRPPSESGDSAATGEKGQSPEMAASSGNNEESKLTKYEPARLVVPAVVLIGAAVLLVWKGRKG